MGQTRPGPPAARARPDRARARVWTGYTGWPGTGWQGPGDPKKKIPVEPVPAWTVPVAARTRLPALPGPPARPDRPPARPPTRAPIIWNSNLKKKTFLFSWILTSVH